MLKENAGYLITNEIEFKNLINGKSLKIVTGTKPGGQSVTWEYTITGGYYWGHYFSTHKDAVKDMYERATKEISIKEEILEESPF